jgi:hypothetical protein
MDEINDYAASKPLPRWAQGRNGLVNARKPDRFAKVITGYSWHRYNRTHYNSATNPPPKTIMAYEFTLLFPDLVDPSKAPGFKLEPTPEGWDGDFCNLIFSAGPPYLDVAYRIVNKQWDKRRGGMRAVFEANGKFKLYFRFTSTGYRR